MTISILGCGWYGLPLAKALVNDKHKVRGSTTSVDKLTLLEEAGVEPFLINLSAGEAPFPDLFFDTDLLIIAIPPKSRSAEGAEYLSKLQKITERIGSHKIKRVILISSTGVYADRNYVVNEDTPPEPDTAAGKILFEAEELFRNQTDLKTTIIRFAGLVGPGRHPGRFFAGKQDVANGLAPVNLIHLNDCIGITRSIISHEAYGYTFNAVVPHHPTRADFYIQAADKAGLALPRFILKLDNWKIVESRNVPSVLGYQYEVDNWYSGFANAF